MKKCQRNTIKPLPYVPPSAEFILGNHYARINLENELLDLYKNDAWVSTGKTLTEFNDYFIKDSSEIYVRDFIQKESNFHNNNEKNIYFYYDEISKAYYFTYNKPVYKGTKIIDGEECKVIKSGERNKIRIDKYPQIQELIELHFGYFDLYVFEEKVRKSFEDKLLTKGKAVPNFNLKYQYYDDVYFQQEFEKFREEYYNDLLSIDLNEVL